MAHAVTLHKPLRVHQVGTQIYAVNGTPVDCVNLAVLKLLPAPPDLLVSGINKGVNLGDDVLYSGRVLGSDGRDGILGAPSMAVSQEGKNIFISTLGSVCRSYRSLDSELEGLPDETLVNLNIPNRPFGLDHRSSSHLSSRRRFDNPIIEKVDPHGRTYYWIAGTRISWSRSKDADHEALEEGAVSLTPIHLDTTNHGALDRFRKWETVHRPNARRAAASSKPKGKQRS